MCIIIIKPLGKKIPESLIKRQWQINSDGAGFAVRIDDKPYPLYFKKGIMSLSELLEDEEFREFNSEDYELVLHLRKSTGGGVRPELCHPFPVLSKNRLEGYSKALLFHNGTFGLKVPRKYQDKLSDTAYLAWFARRIGLANFRLLLKQDILNRNGSRVLLWTDSGMLFKGKWHNHKGLKVSKPVYEYSYYGGYYRSSYSNYQPNLTEYTFGFDEDTEDIETLEVNSDLEILPSSDGRKVIRISNRGEKLSVIAKMTDNSVLLEDGSLWEPPESVADQIDVGDLIEF